MNVTCEMCGQALDPRTYSCFQYIEGWAKLRRAGGPNAVAHPIRQPRYACGPCVQAHADHTLQGTLL